MRKDSDRNRTADDREPEIDLPGLGGLRSAVLDSAIRRLPSRRSLRRDGVAGLTVAIANVPDGMASGALAGVNPIYGLYASAVGPVVGGFLSSAALMVITNTSATALVAGQALFGLTTDDRDSALFLMVMLAGAFQILFGLLRLGRLTRFVSYSVMTGFLAGIATVLILSQLPTITGYEASGENRIAQTYDLLIHLGEAHLPSVGVAVLTLVVALGLGRTRVGKFASLVAIVVPSVLVALVGPGDMRLVQDVGEIPGGVPSPFLPALEDFQSGVFTGALSVALVGLVQGAGVSQSVPNPDGSRGSVSRDFIAQGAANVAAGMFRGVPVGGSLGASAINVVSGAGRRWAAIFAGVWMAVVVVAFPAAVARVAMPALGGLLVLAGARSIKPSDVQAVWQAGWVARIAGSATFAATLILPIQLAVGLGVLLSAILVVGASSTDVSIVQWIERADGRIEEQPAPKRLRGGAVTVLSVYGSIFYAGARTLERKLPRPDEERNPVVVLRLRGYTTYGATLVKVLTDYADRLQDAGGRLYLTGIDEDALERLRTTGDFHLTGPIQIYEAEPVIGESTRRALEDARAWLVGKREGSAGSERVSERGRT